MHSGPEHPRSRDSVVLLFLFALLVFVSPLTDWWARGESAWYLPYLLWLGLIGLIAAIVPWRDRRDL